MNVFSRHCKYSSKAWANILGQYLVVSCGMGFYYFYPVKIKIVRHVQLWICFVIYLRCKNNEPIYKLWSRNNGVLYRYDINNSLISLCLVSCPGERLLKPMYEWIQGSGGKKLSLKSNLAFLRFPQWKY